MICSIYRIQCCNPASRFDVTGAHDGLDVSADVEVAFKVDAQRIAGGDEVFQDDVDYVLVEDFYVAEGVYVELQTLQLDTTLVWNVCDPDGGEVGEVGERADGRKLRNLEIDFNLAARKLVSERVQRKQIHLRSRRRLNIKTLLIWRRQWTFVNGHQGTILTTKR
jgi:hypothetical protein